MMDPERKPVLSELPGFFRLPLAARRKKIAEIARLSAEDVRLLSGENALCAEQADHMVENVLGIIGVPLGLCVNLLVDGRDVLVPMAIEEASVIAAASHAAKLLRQGGGIRTQVAQAQMIGQIQLLCQGEFADLVAKIQPHREELLASANSCDACLLAHGGGARDLEFHYLPPLEQNDPLGPMFVVHLIVDVRDAMGANTVNAMCEHISPRIEELTRGQARLKILSNLADRRLVQASGRVPFSAFAGKSLGSAAALAQGIQEASIFAERDPYRAATHNKGIMNGVDAVLVACGQDWRAVEAGAHAFAARTGRYSALSRWRVQGEFLVGDLEMPMCVGVVGGVTAVSPTFQMAKRLTQIQHASELASLTAAVGLAQNLGALRALAAEGIQKGHMRVHARNIAVAAGAMGLEVDQVAQSIAEEHSIQLDRARFTLQQLRNQHALAEYGETCHMRERFRILHERFVPQLDGLIEEVIHEAVPEDSSLAEMCSYHMQTGGKRIRGLLPLLVAEALGHEAEHMLPFGAACEMLHNATLVHDDVQDGDVLRRGLETVWSRYGEAQAINLGDAMFYFTLQLIHKLDFSPSRREAAARRILRETLRVIDGQERELKLKWVEHPTCQDYFTMVEGKTSGLFALPLAGTAQLCDFPAAVVHCLEEAARHIGVLFQIQDDVLDLFGSKGRDQRGSDICEGKRSLLVVHALQKAQGADRQRLLSILNKPRSETITEEIQWAKELFVSMGSLDFCLGEISKRKELALQHTLFSDYPQLLAVIGGMCDLFLEPIQELT